jgi:branched-subunit amino acid ABC-type transport system permease component
MQRLISYFINYPIVANLFMILVLVFGYFGLTSIKSSFFPETESDTIIINAVYPGAAPEEIEQGVVLKVEDNLEGITGIDRFTSVSKENSATVTVEVEKGYNTNVVLQDVKNAVDRISSFPADLESTEVFKKENVSEAMRFAISGDISLKALKRYARNVEDELRATDGISKIKLSGFPEEEIEVGLDKGDLRAYDLTFQQVSRNLEITNGPDGISFLSTLPPTTFYYAFLGLLVGEMALVHYLSSTQFGYTLNAIRDDEEKVTAMGVNTTLYKTAAWMIAALFTGMAGGTWSLFNFYVNPFTAYNLAWNVELIAMSLLGGAGTVLGPVLGAFGLHGLIALVIDPYFAGWQLGVLGFVVILTVIALPEGIVGWFQQRASAMEYYEYGGGAAGDEAAGTGATADAEPDPTTEESV